MREEQLGDNKTKEIRIIQDNAIWKVINHEGRTLDATRTRAEAEESVAILVHFPEYGGRWPLMLLNLNVTKLTICPTPANILFSRFCVNVGPEIRLKAAKNYPDEPASRLDFPNVHFRSSYPRVAYLCSVAAWW